MRIIMCSSLLQSLYLSLVLLVALPSATSAIPVSGPINATVTLVSMQGAGCPTNTVWTQLSNDGAAIILAFDEFQMYYGPAYAPTQQSKSCILNLGLNHLPGYTFSIMGATYRGYATLDLKLNAAITSSYTITNAQAGDVALQTRATVSGGLVGEYAEIIDVPSDSVMSSPCDKNSHELHIATRAALSSGSATVTGSLTGDPALSLGYHQLHLRWAMCKG
jgi:hypothetical protein